MTLPSTVTVLLDDGTGAFPYDVSKYFLFADGFSYNRGRADWQGGVTAGVLNLTLNNSDGRFTPGSTLIASPSPIRVDQRIRVKETVNGTTFTRFTGYVKSWPVQWPATVGTIAFSSITAVDAQARAERHTMLVGPAEEILADSPTAYWPLNDALGSVVAVDGSGGSQSLPLDGSGSPPVFGSTTAPGSTASTAATFAAGKYFTTLLTLAPIKSILVAFNVAAGPANFIYTRTGGISSAAQYGLSMNAAGLVSGFENGVGIVTTVASFADGQPHVAELVIDNSPGLRLYVDGVLIGTAAASAPASPGIVVVGEAVVGTLAHVAIFGTASSAARVSAHSTMLLTGGAGERTDQRVARLAYYANVPTGTLDTGQTTVPAQDTAGTSTWDAINTVVETEMGSAFVDESGNVEFHNRNKVSLKTTPDLSLVAHQYIAPDFTPTDDDQSILNYVETTSSVTGVTQVVRNTTSELGNGTATNPGHGRYSDSKTYLVSTDAEALDRANWIVANFAEPTTRYGSLTVNLFAMPPAQAAAFLTALDLDMWLRVTSAPSQNTTGTTVDVVVEGFTETCKANEWYVTCNVVLRSLFNALILDNATYGVLDSSVARLGV